jgi:tetratricopeptide (TPR) repeat protein
MLKLQCVFKPVGVCLVLLLGGCSIYSLPGGEPAPVEKAPEYTPVTPPSSSPRPATPPSEPTATSSGYRSLVDKADQASARGDYEQALALLERAQRIDPDNGGIYLNLARTYTAKGDAALASATAERGLLYCSGQSQCDALRVYIR